jgi:hypothetical protein
VNTHLVNPPVLAPADKDIRKQGQQKEGIPMANPTPKRDDGMAWLARQLRWERSLDALRFGAVDEHDAERKAA